MTWAAAGGIPEWRSTQARSVGPSLRRKNRLRTVNARNAASEASSSMLFAMPLRKTLPSELTEEVASCWRVLRARGAHADVLEALGELVGGAPQLRGDFARLARDAAEDEHAEDGPERTIASSISAAPAPRGTPRRRSRLTSGAVTEAMSVAVITGTTIVLVRASSQTRPTRTSTIPTSSHATTPASRSHAGATNTRSSAPGSSSKTSVSRASPRPGRVGEPRGEAGPPHEAMLVPAGVTVPHLWG